MKGIVLEIKKNKAAILLKDGSMVLKKNRQYHIGEEIDGVSAAPISIKGFAALAAAVTGLFLFGGGYAYATPYAYVSLDMNPSMEYEVNRFDRVIGVKALNEDGKALLDQETIQRIRHKSIDEAVVTTVTVLDEEGYFRDNEADEVLVAATGNNQETPQALVLRLQEKLKANLKARGLSIAIQAITMTKEQRKEALAQGVSMGKYFAISQLRAAKGETGDLRLEEYENLSVRELKVLTEEQQGRARTDSPEEIGVQEQNSPGNSQRNSKGTN